MSEPAKTSVPEDRKMGVTQFLGTHPQEINGIGDLVKSLYAGKILTEIEWAKEIDTLLSRKLK